MPMNWILLSLTAPLFWALSNFVDKYILGKYSRGIFDFLFFSALTSWPLFLVLVLFNGFPALTAYSLIPIATGFALLYSYGFYGKALEGENTSTIVILSMLVPVLIVVLAYIFLGQKLSSNEMLGFLIVLAGASIISLENVGSLKLGNIFIKGFWLILTAIVIWSAMTLLIDYGLTKIPFWDYFALDTLGSAFAGLTLLAVPSMRKQIVLGLQTVTARKHIWFNGNNLLDFFGQMSMKKALAIAPSAGLVSVVAQAQSFYAIAIGIALTVFVPAAIKEDISGKTVVKKLIGALIMFSGVYILLIWA
jgi:drug/metabolite transporter (DMT)-like permease